MQIFKKIQNFSKSPKGEETLNQHWADNHGVNGPSINTERVQEMGNMSLLSTKQSVRGFFQTFRFTLGNEQVVDPFEYFVANERGIVNFVNKRLDSRTMKFSVCVRVDFSKPISLDKTTSYFNSVTETVSRCLSEEEFYRHVDQILNQISIFCTAGSGWVIERMAVFDVKICKYSPMRAATYIPTPKKIQKLRRTVLNIQNLDDSLCFVYCILAALFPVKTNQQRPSSYKSHLGALYFNKKKMPMPLSGIPAFKKSNNLAVNVYAHDGNEIYPAYISKQKQNSKKIHLLLISNEEKSHYCLIKNLDRLLKTLLRSDRTACSKNNIRKFCDRCLQSIDRNKMTQHRQLCFDQSPLLIQMPASLQMVQFSSYNKQTRSPFVVYADLEAFDVKNESYADMIDD